MPRRVQVYRSPPSWASWRRNGSSISRFIGVKKIDADEKESFEFSEWTVTSSSSHNLRVVIIYRPPYSDEHKVSTNVFFTEFSTYLESILLSKEQLLITGDFNIHIDAVDDPDSLKLLDLLESVGLRQHVS